MSSPTNFCNSIPSSASSSSSTDSSISPSKPLKTKPFNNKHDKYRISAEQWTPIIGPSLPKTTSKSSPEHHPIHHLVSTDLTLVKLFDPASISSSHLQLDQPLLVTPDQKVSLYVACFEDMLNTVLEHEHYLFSSSELILLSSWHGLSYPSKYLFVRLFMRKHDNWFRLDKLSNYCPEIGEIQPACEALCQSIDQLIRDIPPKPNPNHLEQHVSIPEIDPSLVHDDALISELTHFLSDPSQPVLTNSPSHSELPITNLDPNQLEEWCLAAGRLSLSLNQALHAHGIHNWSSSAPPPYDLDDFTDPPHVPPIPPAVRICPPIMIAEPNRSLTLSPNSPPAFSEGTPFNQYDSLPAPPTFSSISSAIPTPETSTIKPVQKYPNSLPRTPSPPAFDRIDPEMSAFASMTSSDLGLLNTDELFSCMNLDELKALAKKLHANPHTTRDMIILGIKAATRNQSTLFGAAPPKGKQKRQLSLKFTQKGLKESQILSLNSRILKIIGPCIKLTPKVCSLFKRLHLIFYRSTTISEKTMTASMLARMNIRSYPNYQVIRTNSIFDSRQSLIEYEKALELEKKFDDLLINERKPWNEDQQAKLRRQEAKTARLKKALDVFENAWFLWQQTVIEEDVRLEQLQLTPQASQVDIDRSTYYKRRFHPGWPLTRILQKGLGILARFKEYEREVHVLEALLQQRHFRRGKRGQWYDRLALVLMSKLSTSMNTIASPTQINDHQQSALYTCEQGLLDPDTHQIYRFSLSRRLVKLQSILAQQQSTISRNKKNDRHDFSNNPEEVNDSTIDLSSMEEWKSAPKITIHRLKLSDDHQIGKKSTWKSLTDDSSLTVEEVSLEHYASEGWRGFHSEGGVLKMIFSLVFWNIIFAPVPGAFETPYQTAPLDIATDAFAIVRRPLIEEQMNRIEMLGNEEIKTRLKETYMRESEKKTMCIGINHHNWNRFTLQDLLEIVDCFKPQSFNLICRVFFEDWSIWSAGVPDLCLWKSSENKCKFVEVKGPGDKLSEQQKNWVNLLLKAEGIGIEICSVKEDESQ